MRRMAVVFLCVGACWAALAEPITTGALVEQLVDLHRLTRFPAPGFKTVQFSSYDRSSSLPGGPGWFANSDGFGGEPTPNFEAVLKAPSGNEPGEYLVCDVEGPGAIVRLWTARIGGTIRMYLDGAETPVYDGPAEPFFLRPYDAYLEGSGLDGELLDGALYQRNASYAPIPFAKHCRIVWSGNHKEIHFYEVQVRKYEAGAEVVTFAPGDVKAEAERIRRVASILKDIDRQWPYRSQQAPAAIHVKVAPHGAQPALKLEGPGALERLVLKVSAADVTAALRQTVLHVRCDGYPWGQVQAPVGDFFGAGPGINPYSSAPFSVAPDGTMTCRYVMPYKESLEILFDNRGDQEVTIEGSALPVEYAWDDAASMHFRARWRADHGLVASGDANMGVQDLPFVVARGQGVYVGTAVMLLNPNEVPSSGGNWWGEGDEKIFVDDDARPSTFGTGSEDYFNYAWSATDIFTFPYCGQPRNDGPANRGFVVNYRWHVIDPLPFRDNIAFFMELFSHERTEGVSYARVGYHYGRPGIADDHAALTDEDVRVLSLPATWEPAPRGAASGFAFKAVEDLAATTDATAFEEGGLWQGGRVLVWTPASAGEELALRFAAEKDGAYDLWLDCKLQPGGGSFRASLDGEPLKFDGQETVSLDDPHRVLSRVLGARREGLKAGEHTLTLTAAEPGRPIGLDFLGVRGK